MKSFQKLAFLLFLLPFFINCSDGNNNERTTRELSLKAAINPTCTTDITFRDLNDNVYGYRADDLFSVPSVQAGGHSDADELTDLGVNIFVDLESLLSGNYAINGGTGTPGTAYVYYYRLDGSIFISTDANTGNMVVEILEFNEEGTVTKLKGTFNNVEVANNDDPSDTLCINSFELIYTL